MATGQRRPGHGYADGELGVLREGALADLIVVDLQKPHLQPIHDVFRTWSTRQGRGRAWCRGGSSSRGAGSKGWILRTSMRGGRGRSPDYRARVGGTLQELNDTRNGNGRSGVLFFPGGSLAGYRCGGEPLRCARCCRYGSADACSRPRPRH